MAKPPVATVTLKGPRGCGKTTFLNLRLKPLAQSIMGGPVQLNFEDDIQPMLIPTEVVSFFFYDADQRRRFIRGAKSIFAEGGMSFSMTVG